MKIPLLLLLWLGAALFHIGAHASHYRAPSADSVVAPPHLYPVTSNMPRSSPQYLVGITQANLDEFLMPEFYANEFAETYEINMAGGQPYTCYIPSKFPVRLPKPSAQSASDADATTMTSARAPASSSSSAAAAAVPKEIVPMQFRDLTIPEVASRVASSLKGLCFSIGKGYWSYEVCPLQNVTQFHRERGEVTTKFNLGKYVPPGSAGGAIAQSIGGKYAEVYEEGSDDRQTSVRYVCPSDLYEFVPTQDITLLARATQMRGSPPDASKLGPLNWHDPSISPFIRYAVIQSRKARSHSSPSSSATSSSSAFDDVPDAFAEESASTSKATAVKAAATKAKGKGKGKGQGKASAPASPSRFRRGRGDVAIGTTNPGQDPFAPPPFNKQPNVASSPSSSSSSSSSSIPTHTPSPSPTPSPAAAAAAAAAAVVVSSPAAAVPTSYSPTELPGVAKDLPLHFIVDIKEPRVHT